MTTPLIKNLNTRPLTLQTDQDAEATQIQILSLFSVIASITLGILTLYSVFSTVFRATSQAQIWYYAVISGFALIAGITSFLTSSSLFRDTPTLRTFILNAAIQIPLLITALLIKQCGAIGALLILSFTLTLSSIIEFEKQSETILLAGIIGAFITAIINSYSPFTQITDNLITIFFVIALLIFLSLYIYFLVSRKIQATLRLKITTTALAVVIIPVVIFTTIQYQFLVNSLRTQTFEGVSYAADKTAGTISTFIQNNQTNMERLSNFPLFESFMTMKDKESFFSVMENTINTATKSLIPSGEREYLVGYTIINDDGLVIFDTDRLNVGKDLSTSETFRQSIVEKKEYVSPILFEKFQNPYFDFSIPLYSSTNDETPIGVFSVRYDAKVFEYMMDFNNQLYGEYSSPLLVNNYNIVMVDYLNYYKEYTVLKALTGLELEYLTLENRLPSETLEKPTTDYSAVLKSLQNPVQYPTFSGILNDINGPVEVLGAVVPIDKTVWKIVYVYNQSGLVEKIDAQTRILMLIASVLTALASIASILLARSIVSPITDLTITADKIASGDLTAKSSVQTRDELGTLSSVFNLMTKQLQSLITDLEDRVLARTRDLNDQNKLLRLRSQQIQTISDVARNITQTVDLEVLLRRITVLISDRFNFYHVGVFLVDDKGEFAVLRSSNSAGGAEMLKNNHKLKVGHVGIVGYVTGTGRPRIATDVGEDAVFFNNPFLPDTRSEMALPLIVGDTIIGALDVQSTKENSFSNEDIELFSALADQIAIAITNNRLYTETAVALKDMESIHRQYLRQEWQKEIDKKYIQAFQYTPQGVNALQIPPIQDFTPEMMMGKPVIRKSNSGENSLTQTLIDIPILVRGEPIGIIQLEDVVEMGLEFNETEAEIVQQISDQIAIALENARLFEQTVKRAEREKKVMDITNQFRSTNNTQQMLSIAIEAIQKELRTSRTQVIFKNLDRSTGSLEPSKGSEN
jgi:GAF domain-containing protein/HAMP domain-containing protein